VARPTHTEKPRRKAPLSARQVKVGAAMTFIALLGLPLALPALAAPGADSPIPVAGETPTTQTLVVDATAAVSTRDGYSVTTPPPPPPPPPPVIVTAPAASNPFTRTADTFTNNPLSPIQWPFTTGVPISDGFGYRSAPCGSCSTNHKGLDMNPGEGTPIQVVADGVVSVAQASDNGGLGVYVEIEHVIDGQQITSVYAHMLEGSLQLSKGQTVTVGQIVGQVGNTGTSTGAHLHFEIHADGTPVDPFAWLTEHVLL